MAAIITNRVNNTLAAVSGAILLVLTHILSIEDCVGFIDAETIGILVGMMLMVSVIKTSGIIEYIAIKSDKLAKVRGPSWLFLSSSQQYCPACLTMSLQFSL